MGVADCDSSLSTGDRRLDSYHSVLDCFHPSVSHFVSSSVPLPTFTRAGLDETAHEDGELAVATSASSSEPATVAMLGNRLIDWFFLSRSRQVSHLTLATSSHRRPSPMRSIASLFTAHIYPSDETLVQDEPVADHQEQSKEAKKANTLGRSAIDDDGFDVPYPETISSSGTPPPLASAPPPDLKLSLLHPFWPHCLWKTRTRFRRATKSWMTPYFCR